ncbi:MAG: DUF935 domain-containing protein [Burkholderiales bacterium]|jgi:phage gp29-like protein|nr:DUF935 domain-containing protein [Burkholderiales bacterium]
MTEKLKQNDSKAMRPEKREIATRARDIWRRPYGGVIQNYDDTLITRGGGKGIWLYDELERDTTVYASLSKRKSAVTSRAWKVDPASEDAPDVVAADLVRAALEGITFDDACYHLLDALLKGFAVTEIMWDNSDGQTVVAAMIPRDQRRFTFAEDGSLRLLTEAQPFTGEELPPRKFIVHSVGAKDGNPFGLGLGTRLFWPVWFKREGMEFWLTFADKFGSPTAVGKYPAGTPDSEQRNLLASMARIAQDAAIAVPDSMLIELLEASRAGGGDTYERLLRYCDEMITEAVLGEANSSRETGGSLAAASIIRNEVRLELSRADSDLLSAVLNKTLVQWLIDFNMPGARAPKVWRDFDEGEDLKTAAERDQILFNIGWKRKPESLTAIYGDGFEPVSPTSPLVGEGQGVRGTPTFAAPTDADVANAAFDAMIEALPPQALNEQARQMLQPVIDAIFAAGSYEEMLTAIDNVVPGLKLDKLETALGRAMFVAQTYGRMSADERNA